jgi:hypothetical protein
MRSPTSTAKEDSKARSPVEERRERTNLLGIVTEEVQLAVFVFRFQNRNEVIEQRMQWWSSISVHPVVLATKKTKHQHGHHNSQREEKELPDHSSLYLCRLEGCPECGVGGRLNRTRCMDKSVDLAQRNLP